MRDIESDILLRESLWLWSRRQRQRSVIFEYDSVIWIRINGVGASVACVHLVPYRMDIMTDSPPPFNFQ